MRGETKTANLGSNDGSAILRLLELTALRIVFLLAWAVLSFHPQK